MIELFSTDASVSLAVLSAGGRATQPYDSGLGDLLKTSAAQEQLFEDTRSWKPRLIVANLPDWSPEVSGLTWELVLKQRQEGQDVVLRYPVKTTMPLHPSHVEVGLHLVYETLDGRIADASSRTPRFWWAATSRALADRLSLDSRCGSSIRTHSDSSGNLLRRHQVRSK